MKSVARSSAFHRRAVTTVESALILSAVLLLIFGGLNLGLAVTRYNALGEAARRAARSVLVHGNKATQLGTLGPTSMTFTADQSNSIADSFRYILSTMNPADVKAIVTWPDGTNQVDDRVNVTLQYRHKSFLPSFLGVGNIDMQAASTMTIEH